MIDKIKQLTQNPDTFMEYQKWCRDPMTKMVHEAMVESAVAEQLQPMKMVGQQGVSIELNALDNARLKGMFEMLARMVNFTDKKIEQMPEEDYGTGQPASGGAVSFPQQ